MSAPTERRPPIGPVLSAIAAFLAEWWLGLDQDAVTADEPPVVPDDVSELTAPDAER